MIAKLREGRAMRRFVRLLVCGALVGSVAGVAGPAGAVTAADATCEFAGLMTFSPGLTVATQAVNVTVSDAHIGTSGVTSCPLVPEMSDPATVSGTFAAASLHCRDNTSNVLVADSPATGKLKVKWPDSTVSVWRTAWTPGKKPNHFVFRGKVAKGPYAGDAAAAHAGGGITRGTCLNDAEPVTQMSFFAYGANGETLLTFSPG